MYNLPSVLTVDASIARDSLAQFVRRAWGIIEPGNILYWNWHLDVICKKLELCHLGKIKRLIINVPPGMGKSILGVMFNAWVWAKDPTQRFLTISYSNHNTLRDNVRFRQIVQSTWYRDRFDVSLSSDQNAKERIDTTKHGYRIASSVGGVATGEHPNYIDIDDPLKASEKESRVSRDFVNEWYKNTVSTRKARNPCIVVRMQRLHEDDLSGYKLRDNHNGTWVHVNLPMRFESQGVWDCPCHQVPDSDDVRTYDGELLFPRLFSEERVKEMERELDLEASGQLAQRPKPLQGGFIERKWFDGKMITDISELPNKVICGRGWDTAASKDSGDQTSGTKMGVKIDAIKQVKYGSKLYHRAECRFFVMDTIVCHTDEVDGLIVSTAILDGKPVLVREEQEPGGSGKTVIKSHSQLLSGYNYEGVSITGDKMTRGRPFRAQCIAGNVFVVVGETTKAWIDEVCGFPLSRYDDQFDSTTCVFNSLMVVVEQIVEAHSRKKKKKSTWNYR